MLFKSGRRSIHMASKKVLVLNAGSSSLKFKLFDEAKNKLVASVSGLIERIGDTSNSQVIPHAQRFHVYAVTSYCNTASFPLLPVLLVPSLMYPPSVKFEHTTNAHSCYIRMPTTYIAGHLCLLLCSWWATFCQGTTKASPHTKRTSKITQQHWMWP